MNNYISRFEINTHDGDEERLWARILSEGDSAKGMSLVFIQKLCTASHEFESLCQKSILDKNSLNVARERLSNRIQAVLIIMKNNKLDSSKGYENLIDLSDSLATINSTKELETLLGEIHKTTHKLSESLESVESK